MSRRWLRFSQIVIDFLVLTLAFLVGFLLRFDGVPPAGMTGRLLLTGPYVVLFEYLVLVGFGVHRFSWRYVGLREVARITVAFGTSNAVVLAARLIVGQLKDDTPYLRHGVIPVGVLAINGALGFLGLVGVRVLRRMAGERSESQSRRVRGQLVTRTLLVGAGQAGVLVARELRSRPDLAVRAVGFVDDDLRKIGTVIHGVPVLGATSELPALCKKFGATQALITMASAPGVAIRKIRELCEDAGITTKIIPGLYEIVGGTVNLSRIRDVAIEDLLGRAPVQLDVQNIAANLTGKVVVVTGAGGSIGGELCRQICRFAPRKLLLVEQAEGALFNIHRELIAAHPELEVVPCIADVSDAARIDQLFAAFAPNIVLHAAAHKHVPMMEWNPGEAIKNNVFGTKVVADAAAAYSVETFVMISTDKAVNPTSVMGATKRAAEIYVQAVSRRATTRFVAVRFGNVLGSAGSVIPIFREQIARGGPVTVTHPDMRRYFMTIPEACQLVLQAGTMGEGGEIFILDMGEPVKVVDLARDLIALSGLREGEDIEITFTGIRPGEKLTEELSSEAEQSSKTRHPMIFVGRIEPREWDEVNARMEALAEGLIAAGHDGDALRSALCRVVPEYSAAREPHGGGRIHERPEPSPEPSRPLLHRAFSH